jgi:CheY-like chemotaxis protein
MDEATLERAIEPFFSTKELGKGTGLGLSMVHGLAVQSGGALSLTSKPGHGTIAQIWLPVATEAAAAVVEEHATVDKAVAPATILVVDDDALIAMSTADMLQDLGHEVIEAYSGQKALEILRSRTVQLMITDYAMPGMTGLQLAVAARELHPELHVLLATGYADLPDGSTVDLPRLPKPYMQEQLASQVAKLLGH